MIKSIFHDYEHYWLKCLIFPVSRKTQMLHINKFFFIVEIEKENLKAN